jgi:hypothetical protein
MADNPRVFSAMVDTADEFMRELSSLGERFGTGYFPGGWLYRGHANARWPLLPTTLRPDVKLRLGEWVPGVRGTNLEQIAAETRLIVEFFRVADLNGLTLPEDSQRFRCHSGVAARPERGVGVRRRSAIRQDAVASGRPAVAHCARTTSRPAHAAPRLDDERVHRGLLCGHSRVDLGDGTVARTTRRRHALVRLGACAGSARGQPDCGAERQRHASRMVTAPAAGNVNLRAQKALFLVDRRPGLDLDGEVDRRPWNEALVDMFPLSDASSDDPVLTQVGLPIEEAPRLLRLLAFQGVDAATVFPGFDGVVKALEERRLWETMQEARERSLFD